MSILERYEQELGNLLGDDKFRRDWFTDNMHSFESYPWQPLAIHPDIAKRREVSIHHTAVEVMGLFHAGKSSLVNYLVQSLGDNAKVFREFEIKERDFKADSDNLADAGARAPANGMLEMVKILQFEVVTKWMVQDALDATTARRQIKEKVIINERGVNDVFPFTYWLTSLSQQPAAIENKVSAETIQTLFYSAISRAFVSDAIILYGVSRETNKRRRIEMGKNPNGKLANDIDWPIMEQGYSWWLGSIYPLIRKRFGTGLLIVDGEQPLEENN